MLGPEDLTGLDIPDLDLRVMPSRSAATTSRIDPLRPMLPPRFSPKPAPETLAAAHLLGITEFYRVGGAHAIAALAIDFIGFFLALKSGAGGPFAPEKWA